MGSVQWYALAADYPINRTENDAKKDAARQSGSYGNKSYTLKGGAGDGGKPAHISPGGFSPVFPQKRGKVLPKVAKRFSEL